MLNSVRVLKVHIEAAKRALTERVYPTIDEAAEAVATAVIEEQGPTRWVVLKQHGTAIIAYGPYASAATARKAIDSGLMLGTETMLLPMQPVPRRGHR